MAHAGPRLPEQLKHPRPPVLWLERGAIKVPVALVKDCEVLDLVEPCRADECKIVQGRLWIRAEMDVSVEDTGSFVINLA